VSTPAESPILSRRPSSTGAPGAGARPPLSVRLALAAGLAVTAATLALVLMRPPLTAVAGSNGVPAVPAVAFIHRGDVVNCQGGGTVPKGTEAIRVSLSANIGPRVSLKVLSGSTVVTEGERDAGWGADETVTVPVARVARSIPDAGICTTVGPIVEPIQMNGAPVRTSGGRNVLWLRMEYLRPGPSSWLSLAGSIADRMGIAHAPSGAWVAWLTIAVMIAVGLLAVRLVLREAAIAARTAQTADGPDGPPGGAHTTDGPDTPRADGPADPSGRARRLLPRAALTCALVAFLSAACWSVITPPFQVPDEPSHFAYAQLLAETGRLPSSNHDYFSREEMVALRDLDQRGVQWHPEVGTISSPAAELRLRRDLARPLNRADTAGAGVAASQPPLYYALETIPYYLASSGSLLDRLEAMRLLSALLAALTALFVFLFLREILPGAPWAWTVGGLAAALAPLLGFTSGAVTPDALLCPVSAALFWALARAFRRGLTRRSAAAIGALIAAGFLTKLNFVGIAPGALLGLAVLAFRGAPSAPGAGRRRRAFGPVALAAAIAVSPVCLYLLDNLLNRHHALGILSTAGRQAGGQSILAEIEYAWQFYLPRLPGMFNWFPGLSTFRQMWFARTVGLYGWLDTEFPVWVYNLALIPAGLIALLSLRTLIARRATLRARLPELLVYLAMTVGLMVLIGVDSHMNRFIEGAGYSQPRYLLPLLPLAAVVLALAARGAGRRRGPVAGALIVVLFFAHDIFSQLLVVARFYG
jgi:Predicted membrane protein (DUF2142)